MSRFNTLSDSQNLKYELGIIKSTNVKKSLANIITSRTSGWINMLTLPFLAE